MCANGADGIRDIEGKVARVAASKLGNERVSVSRENRKTRRTYQPARTDPVARQADGRDQGERWLGANITAGRGNSWEGGRARRLEIEATRRVEGGQVLAAA